MARPNFFYGMEADNDEIDVGMTDLVKDEEDVIEDAGKDSETVDVSDISESQSAHNEEASAGGIVVGENAEDITMDPVAATESYIRKAFGLSQEDLDEVAEELEATPTEVAETPVSTGDDDLDNVTTINVVAPAGAETVVDGEDAEPTDVVPDVETPAMVAAVENLYRIQSQEDEDVDGGEGEPDVELSVKTPEQDVDLEFEDKSITLTPNGDEGTGEEAPTEEPAAEEPAGEEPATEEGGEEEPAGEEPAGEEETPPEEGQESWYDFM